MSLTLCFHGPLKGCACAQTRMHTHVRSGRPQVCTPESPDLIEAYSFGNETVTRETRKAAESNWNWPPVRVHECVCLCSLFLGVFNVSAKAGQKFSQKTLRKGKKRKEKKNSKNLSTSAHHKSCWVFFFFLFNILLSFVLVWIPVFCSPTLFYLFLYLHLFISCVSYCGSFLTLLSFLLFQQLVSRCSLGHAP